MRLWLVILGISFAFLSQGYADTDRLLKSIQKMEIQTRGKGNQTRKIQKLMAKDKLSHLERQKLAKAIQLRNFKRILKSFKKCLKEKGADIDSESVYRILKSAESARQLFPSCNTASALEQLRQMASDFSEVSGDRQDQLKKLFNRAKERSWSNLAKTWAYFEYTYNDLDHFQDPKKEKREVEKFLLKKLCSSSHPCEDREQVNKVLQSTIHNLISHKSPKKTQGTVLKGIKGFFKKVDNWRNRDPQKAKSYFYSDYVQFTQTKHFKNIFKNNVNLANRADRLKSDDLKKSYYEISQNLNRSAAFLSSLQNKPKDKNQLVELVKRFPHSVGEALLFQPDATSTLCDLLKSEPDLQKSGRNHRVLWGDTFTGTSRSLLPPDASYAEAVVIGSHRSHGQNMQDLRAINSQLDIRTRALVDEIIVDKTSPFFLKTNDAVNDYKYLEAASGINFLDDSSISPTDKLGAEIEKRKLLKKYIEEVYRTSKYSHLKSFLANYRRISANDKNKANHGNRIPKFFGYLVAMHGLDPRKETDVKQSESRKKITQLLELLNNSRDFEDFRRNIEEIIPPQELISCKS